MTSNQDDLDPMTLGRDDVGEGVQMVRDAESGRVAFVPKAMRDLRGEAFQAVCDLQAMVAVVQEKQRQIDVVVDELRAHGVSWNSIGWCVGTSGDAARKRWGVDSSKT